MTFRRLKSVSESDTLTATEDAVARLDERLRGSIIRDGWTARTHFADTISSLALDGELVQLDDLVLHDSRLDVRAPSPELTCAHALLRLRRRIAGMDPQSTATAAGIAALIGRRDLIDDDSPTRADSETNEAPAELDRDDGDAWATTLAAVDAVLARTDRLLAQPALGAPPLPGSLVRRHDPDRGARLARWIATVEDTDTLPPVLAAARALVAWDQLDPLPDDAGLGRLLAGNLLRARGKTTSHLAAISLGLRTVQPERRRHRDPVVRLLAVVDAIAAAAARGLKDHDRRLTAREALLRRIGKRRGNSKLPKLVELVIAAPLVTTDMIATELSVTHRAALDMIAILDLREVTGRGRYRAWSIT